MIVKNFTTVDYINLSPESTIRETIAAFLHHRVDIGCITRESKLVGIVHKHSIHRALLQDFSMDDSIQPFINESVVTINKDQHLTEAREIMIAGNVSQAVVLDETGKIYGIMSKSDLVTSHMTALENTLNRLTSLIENLQDAVILVDPSLKITMFNKTSLSLLGLNKNTLNGTSIDRVLPPFKKWLIETLKTGEIQEAKRIRYRELTVIASFIPIREFNQISGAMVVLRDVTSYESIANELETTIKLKKILDSALELAYDGVVVTDNNGVITLSNQGFLDLLHFEKQNEIIGFPITEIAQQIPSHQSLTLNKKNEGELININHKNCIVAQMPIYQNGQKLGAIFKIIFRQLDAWKDMLLHMEHLEHEISFYRGELIRISKENDPFAHVITNNDAMQKFKKEATIAAKSFSTILITGESGTGKELIAEGIHTASGREGAFIKVNCAAIPEELLESEFFGYVEGAFTGAKKGGKPGKFELAHNGTLFLDEIGDMPLALQVKLLRVLQEQEFERIGATKTTKVAVRIISATNKDLVTLVKEGKFREDLYYRIHVIHLNIPSLRDRIDDIPILCNHFVKKINLKTNKKIFGVTPKVIQVFQNYHWPGNIRQLENVLERAYHYCQKTKIEVHHLPKEILDSCDVLAEPVASLPKNEADLPINRQRSMDQTEKQVIIQALLQCEGNRTKAARLLGVSRTTLYQKIKKYNIKEELNFTTSY
ncbi:sigma 54-interacting transcriptional regulator [Alkalihalobacterium chitinilyticum]|uniref:Sigma 54-interacting transcriptional regulator n=1 Tax=Alkalihalobacterium chitinilyticum TaxID=2980103 RepID=A0ABT5VLH2_9BACI|nr:sigma 54-interacting transcriptional regulator [Alkalihalobacterium chitinilyticum]MDE5416288.1 sigma 54-interacting transcriptional regulator [Alkalihalobacterium chitinilyticum]